MDTYAEILSRLVFSLSATRIDMRKDRTPKDLSAMKWAYHLGKLEGEFYSTTKALSREGLRRQLSAQIKKVKAELRSAQAEFDSKYDVEFMSMAYAPLGYSVRALKGDRQS